MYECGDDEEEENTSLVLRAQFELDLIRKVPKCEMVLVPDLTPSQHKQPDLAIDPDRIRAYYGGTYLESTDYLLSRVVEFTAYNESIDQIVYHQHLDEWLLQLIDVLVNESNEFEHLLIDMQHRLIDKYMNGSLQQQQLLHLIGDAHDDANYNQSGRVAIDPALFNSDAMEVLFDLYLFLVNELLQKQRLEILLKYSAMCHPRRCFAIESKIQFAQERIQQKLCRIVASLRSPNATERKVATDDLDDLRELDDTWNTMAAIVNIGSVASEWTTTSSKGWNCDIHITKVGRSWTAEEWRIFDEITCDFAGTKVRIVKYNVVPIAKGQQRKKKESKRPTMFKTYALRPIAAKPVMKMTDACATPAQRKISIFRGDE